MSEFIMLNSRPPAAKGEPPMLLIQNAHLIDPASRTDGIRDILIEGEKIIKIAEHIAPGEAAGRGPETAGAAAGAAGAAAAAGAPSSTSSVIS